MKTPRILYGKVPPWRNIPWPRTPLDAFYASAFIGGAAMSALSNFHQSMQVDTYGIGLGLAIITVVYFGFRKTSGA
jgi:hypothetical protein